MGINLNLPKPRVMEISARLWRRTLAFLLDLVILDFVLGTPLREFLIRVYPESAINEGFAFLLSHPMQSQAITYGFMFYGLLMLIYFSVLEYKTGQTIGKMFFGIHVRNYGPSRNFFNYLLRNIQFIFLFPFILMWVVEPITFIFTKGKTRMGEILSKTQTIEIINISGV